MPAVSVVIPTYNRAAFLAQTVRSVLAQSYDDLELIVVDDGSTDNTSEVVQSFADDRISYVRQANQERCAARNNGVRQAKGDLLAFLDDDDLWLPEKLEVQVAAFKKYPQVCAVYGSRVRVDSECRPAFPLDLIGSKCDESARDMRRELLLANYIPTPTVVVRRDAYERVGGFDPALRLAEDWDLWIRLSRVSEFCGLGRPLAAYRVHAQNSVNDSRGMLQAELTVIGRYAGSPDEPTRLRAEMTVYLRHALDALLECPCDEAKSWLHEGLGRAEALDDLRSVPAVLIGGAVSASDCSSADLHRRSRAIGSAAVMARDLGYGVSPGAWLADYWEACAHAAHGLGYRALCLRSVCKLLMLAGISRSRRGAYVAGVRSLGNILAARDTGARYRTLRMDLERYFRSLESLAEHESVSTPEAATGTGGI